MGARGKGGAEREDDAWYARSIIAHLWRSFHASSLVPLASTRHRHLYATKSWPACIVPTASTMRLMSLKKSWLSVVPPGTAFSGGRPKAPSPSPKACEPVWYTPTVSQKETEKSERYLSGVAVHGGINLYRQSQNPMHIATSVLMANGMM